MRGIKTIALRSFTSHFSIYRYTLTQTLGLSDKVIPKDRFYM